VLVGHGRLLAAQKLGLSEVPTLKVENLTESKKRAYRILDNKLQNDSEWELDNLKLELAMLEDEGFELEPWGLESLLPEDPVPEVVEDDFEAEEPTEVYIKTGDLIELGQHRVLCGDSTQEEDVGLLMGGAVAEIMVTDPPYGVEYDPAWREEYDGGSRATGQVENDDRADWTEAWRLFKGQIVYVWHADKFSPVVADSLEKCDFELRNLIIWAKQRHTFGRGHYHHQHEPCWYGVKKGTTANWGGDRTQTTLWSIESNRRNETGHGTQKPIECMARPMRNHGVRSIYDPFLGSGTTLIAADQLGRQCYGMEISPKYCQIILERYKAHCEKEGKPFVCRINGEAFDGKVRA
jgi:DNA modification methylase